MFMFQILILYTHMHHTTVFLYWFRTSINNMSGISSLPVASSAAATTIQVAMLRPPGLQTMLPPGIMHSPHIPLHPQRTILATVPPSTSDAALKPLDGNLVSLLLVFI